MHGAPATAVQSGLQAEFLKRINHEKRKENRRQKTHPNLELLKSNNKRTRENAVSEQNYYNVFIATSSLLACCFSYL